MKPISDEKLERAVRKLEKMQDTDQNNIETIMNVLGAINVKKNIFKRFSVKTGDRIFLIPDDEVYYFHAEDKHTFINTTDKSYIIDFTLKELERRVDPEKFLRVHRGYIINIDAVKSIHQWYGGKLLVKLKNGVEITVSLNYVNDFKAKINL